MCGARNHSAPRVLVNGNVPKCLQMSHWEKMFNSQSHWQPGKTALAAPWTLVIERRQMAGRVRVFRWVAKEPSPQPLPSEPGEGRITDSNRPANTKRISSGLRKTAAAAHVGHSSVSRSLGRKPAL
jgi:hypothetical protein